MIRAKVVLPKNQIHLNSDYSMFYRRSADYMVSSTKDKINNGIRPGNSPLTQKIKKNNLPLNDRGTLLSSLHARSDSKSGSVSTNHVAAKLHQFGGVITPKKAKRLAIPAGAKTRSLMRKYGATPRLCIDKMRKDEWNIWTSKSGKAVMAQEKKSSRPIVLFILKSKIKIPKRKFLFISKTDRLVIKAMFRKAVRR